jgi:hypothetical protein
MYLEARASFVILPGSSSNQLGEVGEWLKPIVC